MCEPAGSGKSTFAYKFESKGMTILSYDKESFIRGLAVHPLPTEVAKEMESMGLRWLYHLLHVTAKHLHQTDQLKMERVLK